MSEDTNKKIVLEYVEAFNRADEEALLSLFMDRAESIVAIQIGIEQVEQGKVKSAKKVFAKIRKKYNIGENE